MTRLSEALDRACSLAAFEKNIRREYHAGKTAKGTQHFAIAMSVLKKSCGVDPEVMETNPKKIVAMSKVKTEDSPRFGSGAKSFNPFRLPGIDRSLGMDAPIHRKAKSGNEQAFLNPEDFTLTASGSIRGGKKKKKRKEQHESFSTLMNWLCKEVGQDEG